jgi:hypothetical protein
MPNLALHPAIGRGRPLAGERQSVDGLGESMSEDILNLVGRRLIMEVSDPWEFGTEVGTHPIPVIVLRVRASQTASSDGISRTEELVVRVEKPFAYRKHKCEFFRVSPRNGTFATLCDEDSVDSNFCRTFSVDEAGDASIGLIGSIRGIREDAV